MRLDVVTPRGRLVSEEVTEFAGPGVLGEFGVLPGHIPFLSGINAGVLRYRTAAGEHLVAVGAGFAQVSGGERIVVLTEEGALPGDIDVAAAQQEHDEVKRQLDQWSSDVQGLRAALEARLRWARARLDAASAAQTRH